MTADRTSAAAEGASARAAGRGVLTAPRLVVATSRPVRAGGVRS